MADDGKRPAKPERNSVPDQSELLARRIQEDERDRRAREQRRRQAVRRGVRKGGA